ncbi:MAG: hypothetical protein LBD86_01465, partial [Spirochaetaceae bacterium]|nr:hypothetical protein [Spirochaetaceae bacterium]
MKKKTLFVSITALCAALMLAGCGNPLDDPSGAPPSGFTFVPVDGLEEGLNALEGMKAGDFNMEGVEFADDGDAGRDNGSFKIDGAELLLEEDLEGGPYYVKFNVAGFTHAEVIFVAYAGGPAGIEFTQDYRLMTGTAAFRGDIPIGTFTPEGGKPPYNYSLVTGTGGNDTGNSDFRGGADGVYAKPGLSAGTYNLYVRCTDSTGKHFQKAITVEAKAYAPPEFNEADFVSF